MSSCKKLRSWFKQTWQELRSPFWQTVSNLLWILFWLFVFSCIWHYALKSEASGKFVISFTEAIAWPGVLLILVGYRYRQPLTTLIYRLHGLVKVPGGLEFTVTELYDLREQKRLQDKIDSSDTTRDKELLQKLKELKLEALRLLGIVISMGTRRDIDLSFYTKNSARWLLPYRPAEQQLLAKGLIEQSGKYYRPTQDGIEVFRLHMDIIKEEAKQ